MKRFHVHVGVADLDRSIGFYSRLFGTDPVVKKPDYAKWMLEDPRLNFAISTHDGGTGGIGHVGVQVETEAELGQILQRLRLSGGPVLDEGRTSCCYAQSNKSWVADPDGVVWEAFLTHGESEEFGTNPDISRLAPTGPENGGCCNPA